MKKYDFKDVVDVLKEYKRQMSEVGEVLNYAKYNFREMVGEGINTWADFVNQPEIGLTVRDANLLCKLFNLQKGINIPLYDLNLATAKFVANKGMSVTEEMVDDIKHLTTKDFRERYYDIVKGVDNAPRTYRYMVFKKCNETGTLSKVYGDNITKIEEKLSELPELKELE